MKKISKFLKKVGKFIAKIWSKADEIVEKVTPIAIKVVEQVKQVNESVTGDIIETIISKAIPGKADDIIIAKIRARLKVYLPIALKSLNISQAITEIEDPNEQLKAIILAINISPNEAKNTFYHGLCTMIVDNLSDGKLTWGEAGQIAEYYYSNIYKKSLKQ
ncbi:MAG: hypothetical protein R6U85_10290 [Salinivirgaceae bacterium]